MLHLPIVPPLPIFLGHFGKIEVDRPHVQRAHLGLQVDTGGGALIDRHARTTTSGGDIHDRIGFTLDTADKLTKHLRTASRTTILRVTRMKMDNSSTGLNRFNRLLGNLIWSHWQVR
ncbi:hypothetical protein D3C73_1414690 [compost metagenome]